MNAQSANALRQQVVNLDLAGCPPREIAERAGCALSTVYKVLNDPHPDRRLRRPDRDDPDDDGPPTIPPGVPPQTVAAVRLLHAADPDRSAAEVYDILAEHHHPRDPDPLPSPRTVARLLRAIRAEAAAGPPAATGPPAPPQSPAVPPPTDSSPGPSDPPAPRPPLADLLRPANALADAQAPADADPPQHEGPAPERFDFPFDPSPHAVHPELASKIRHVVDDLTSSVAARLEKLPDDAASLGVEVAVLRLLLRQTLAELLYAEHGPLGRRRLRAEATNLVAALVRALRAAHTMQPRATTVAAQYLGRLEELMG
jgi:hypothetical protein